MYNLYQYKILIYKYMTMYYAVWHHVSPRAEIHADRKRVKNEGKQWRTREPTGRQGNGKTAEAKKEYYAEEGGELPLSRLFLPGNKQVAGLGWKRQDIVKPWNFRRE